MNLKDIRDAMYAQADWGPKSSSAADERMNKFINRAYNLISLEAPFLFFEDILHFATEPDILPVIGTDTITFAPEPVASGITTINSWTVFQTNAGAADQIDWKTDRSWDGRVIGIQDADGVWHRNIIRTVWQDPDTPAVPQVPAVAATATIHVEENQGVAYVDLGDVVIIGGPVLTCGAPPPPLAPPNFFYQNVNPDFQANLITGAPGSGGVNDPAGSFPPICSAVSVPAAPPILAAINLTATVAGAAGNTIPLAYVPSLGGNNALQVSSASSPVPVSGPINFAGGADAIPAIPSIPGKKYMSFWTPWDTVNFGPGPFNYRIYTEEYPLPDDIIEVRSTRLWKTNNSWPLQVLGQDDAERQNILDKHTDLAKGIPRVLFRRTHFQMPAPSVPAFAEAFLEPAEPNLTIGVGWRGPAPPGTFEYKITYCWGARDCWFRNPGPHHWGANAIDPVNTIGESWKAINSNEQWGQQRYREPRWESAPSAVSPQVSTTSGEHGLIGPAARLTLPNIEYIQGFYWNLVTQNTGGLIPNTVDGAFFERAHAQKSGWFVRIYRRRVATNFTDYRVLGSPVGPDPSIGIGTNNPGVNPRLHKIEEDNSFYLLSEVHIDPLNEGYFMDDGQLLPDYHRRLRDTHGYMNIGLYPVPNKRYEVEVRCVRRPLELENDSDAPYIHAEACDILVDRALQLLYESEGNASMMGFAKQRYERNLLTLSKRYGDLRPSAVPVLKRLSRASPGYRTSIRYRQWWNTPTS